MRISKKALTTVATWAEMHEKPVMLGDIPWGLKRFNIAQQYHLIELKQLYEEICFNAHKHDTSGYQAAIRNVCPELPLHSQDEYMSSLIKYIADNQDDLVRDVNV
jgi:hypothetical protein